MSNEVKNFNEYEFGVLLPKTQLELKNLQKCGKNAKTHAFFVVFHTFFKCSPILAQITPKIIFIEVFCYF